MNQPRDFPEIDDEYARGALETERDALLVRVADLERDRTNLLRDIAYLNGKLDEAVRERDEFKNYRTLLDYTSDWRKMYTLFKRANRAKRDYRKRVRALNQYSWSSRIDKGRTGDGKETGT